MVKKTLKQKLSENQTVEKGSLIVVGTTLLAAGLEELERNQTVAIILIVLGALMLAGREVLKLR